MSKDVANDALQQTWVHSHEEDTPTAMVFRPASYDFPPSRGRRSFELRADGTLVEGGPGPADRAARPQRGSWSLAGGRELRLRPASQPARVMQIESVGKDKLVVRKPSA